tara:strand:+ start:352 stop:594 length:243 start_codon:yes stop_codon:yes gene_type:complete
MHNIKLTTAEVFEVVNVLKNVLSSVTITRSVVRTNCDPDLLSAFKKLESVEMPNYDNVEIGYEVPLFKPRTKKERQNGKI